jgi:hypothetical protein
LNSFSMVSQNNGNFLHGRRFLQVCDH